MDAITVLGLLAGTLTTISFVPQVVKTWRTKSAHDFSLGMLLTFSIGVFLWLLYGIWLNALPVIIANAVTLVLSSLILLFKLKFQ